MKHFNKALVAASLAALTTFTSCVDNEVAPEVKQLRAAQVAFLTAKANLQAAVAKSQEIANAHQEAMNAFAVSERQADVERNKALIAVSLKTAQADLVAAEQAYQIALANLEMEVALAENAVAAEYLAQYSSEMGEVHSKTYLKMGYEAELAEAKLLLASTNSPWEITKVSLEGSLARLNGQLKAEKAALALLVEVSEDPASAIEEMNTVNAEIQKLENENEKIYLEADKKYYESLRIYDKYQNALDAISDFEYEQNRLKSINANIATYTNDVTTRTATYNTEVAELAAKQTILTNAKTALDDKVTKFNTAKNNHDAAYNTLIKAEAALEVAQENYDSDPTNTTYQTELEAAKTAETKAQTDYDATVPLLSDATTDRNVAQSTYNSALSSFNSQQTTVNNALSSLNNSKKSLEEEQGKKVAVEANIVALQAAYDDAVANKAKLFEDYRVAYEASNLMWTAWDINNAKIENLEWVVWNFENFIDNINGAIDSKKEDIADTMEDINEIEEQLADNKIDKAWAEAEVAELEGNIATLTKEIDSHRALADKYKALLDAALGVN